MGGAGNIAKDSPAARYLTEKGIERKDYNSYGARRGNDEVMSRGTFANPRIVNKFMGGKVSAPLPPLATHQTNQSLSRSVTHSLTQAIVESYIHSVLPYTHCVFFKSQNRYTLVYGRM